MRNPTGPRLVTTDDPAIAARGLEPACEADSDLVQQANTSGLVFSPAEGIGECRNIGVRQQS